MKNAKKPEKANASKNQQKENQSRLKQEADKNKENLLNKQSKKPTAALKNKSENEQIMKEEEEELKSQNAEPEQKASLSLNHLNPNESLNVPEVKLHKLVLENFKSFDGKHEIGYFQNFSVVMGPNGSGKSNIIDAICFALGMKTVSLRTKNLKELIFKKQQANEHFADLTGNQQSGEAEQQSSLNDLNNNKKNKNAAVKKQNAANDADNSSNKGAYVELHFRSSSPINLNFSLASQLNNNNINQNNNSVNNLNSNNNINNNNKNKNNKNNINKNIIGLDADEDLEDSGYLIKFKRTISSKGTSEYFIEDRKTSYEDYLEKLEKLNIPSKARYFILVQGAIDTLLSKKNDLSETIEFLSGSHLQREKYEELKDQIDSINSEISRHSGEINSIKLDKNKIKMQIQNEEKFNELVSDLNRLLEKAFLFRAVKEDMNINYNLDLIKQNDSSLKSIQDEKKKQFGFNKKKGFGNQRNRKKPEVKRR